MNDLELKNLLLETCPVLPGQEERAWAALRPGLFSSAAARGSTFASFWRPFAFGAMAAVFALAMLDMGMNLRSERHALAFAESQSPGIYATSFYSQPAQAQVVWLNGMEPSSDKPTYLDPTSAIAAEPKAKLSRGGDPDSL